MKFTVGQTVYYERNKGYQAHRTGVTPVSIQRVGRVWVYFGAISHYGQQRFNAENMRVDGKGYSSPGRIWLTEEDYKASVQRDYLEQKFVTLVNKRRHQQISLTDLIAVVSVLDKEEQSGVQPVK